MQKSSGVAESAPAYPISSVDNALRLLKMFGESKSVRVADARAYLGVAHSTAHRLLAMLVFHEFVVQNPRTRAYEPGPSLVDIGLHVVRRMDLRTEMRPYLEDLSSRFNETVHLAVLDGPGVRYLDGIEGTKELRVGVRTGNVMPAHCTSVGKALLAGLSDDQLRLLYPPTTRFNVRTTHSITSLPALQESLKFVREHGYALNDEEGELGVGSVAVSLSVQGHPASIAIAVPTPRLTPELRASLIPPLLEVVQSVRAAQAP
jgi:IclR family transcriptional regulator, acetate operon repressor